MQHVFIKLQAITLGEVSNNDPPNRTPPIPSPTLRIFQFPIHSPKAAASQQTYSRANSLIDRILLTTVTVKHTQIGDKTYY